MGPRDLRLFQLYWERLRMVARAGGYYVAPFCEERGVTQGDPLSPTIFNVVVDVVVRHWESLLVAEQGGGESSDDEGNRAQMAGRKIQDRDGRRQWSEEGHQRLTVKAEFFYANDGIVTSTDLGWIQLAFDMLTGIFDRVGLRANVQNTVGMVCQNFRVAV